MVLKVLSAWVSRNANWKARLVVPYIYNYERVLDFGCGDLSLAREILKLRPACHIVGIDVIDNSKKSTDIPFTTYDGKTLPYQDSSFDSVISFYVYHHCDDPVAAFRECLRVARKRVILVESVSRNSWDIPGMRLMDWIYNVIKFEGVSLPYTFLSLPKWRSVITDSGASLTRATRLKQLLFPSWMPVGISYVFEVTKTREARRQKRKRLG